MCVAPVSSGATRSPPTLSPRVRAELTVLPAASWPTESRKRWFGRDRRPPGAPDALGAFSRPTRRAVSRSRGEEDDSLAIKPPQQMARKEKAHHRKDEKRKEKRRHRSHSAEGGTGGLLSALCPCRPPPGLCLPPSPETAGKRASGVSAKGLALV